MIVSAERLINWIQLSAILTVLPLNIGPAAQTKTLGSEETFTAAHRTLNALGCLLSCGEAGAAVQVAGCVRLGMLLGPHPELSSAARRLQVLALGWGWTCSLAGGWKPPEPSWHSLCGAT